MRRLQRSVQAYILIIRWCIFLLQLILFLSLTYLQHYTTLILLMISIILNLCVTIFVTIPLPYYKWRTILFIDLILNILFIAETGFWRSPHILYTFTTILMISVHSTKKVTIGISSLVVASIMILPFVWKSSNSLPAEVFSNVNSILLICLLMLLLGITISLTKYLSKLYKRVLSIRFLMKHFTTSSDPISLVQYTERLIQRNFSFLSVYLCLFNMHIENEDWKRRHYRNSLLTKELSQLKSPRTITLDDYLGQKENIFYFPIRQRGIDFGALLIPLRENRNPSRIDLFFFHLFSSLIIQHLTNLKKMEEMFHNLQREIRRNISQDMHDGLAQKLFFLSAQLFRLKMELMHQLSENLLKKFENLEDQVKDCHQEVRGYIHHLRDTRDEIHIFDAIKQLVHRLTQNSDLNVQVITRGYVTDENLESEEVIYRIVEESVSNVMKHAQAQSLMVLLEATPIQWTVHIEDDGIGIREKKIQLHQGGLGLSGMMERVRRLGGTITIRPGNERGTIIVVVIPRGKVGVI